MILLYRGQHIARGLVAEGIIIDEIPGIREAALIDSYTRFQAFYKVVLPQAATRYRFNRHLLPDLCVERICLCRPADIGDRADGASFIPPSSVSVAGLAGGRGRRDPVLATGHGLHNIAAQTPATGITFGAVRDGQLLQGSSALPARSWEMLASAPIALGVLMLMRGFCNFTLHLLLRRHVGGHGHVHRRQSLSG